LGAYARVLSDDGPRWVRAVDRSAVARTAAELFERLRDGSPAPGGAPVEGPFLAPAEPTKIVCVGLNYLHHAREMNKTVPDEPLLFLKPPSALLAPGGVIELPPASSLVHHEGELAVVIGRRARKVDAKDALEFMLGVTCLNDVTARDIQRREGRYTRGKGFDTFAPCGPLLWTGVDPQALHLSTHVNGTLRQESVTSDMIFSVATVLSFVSHIMTLEPGDIVTTGTPSGVGPLVDGDEVAVTLRHPDRAPLVLNNSVRGGAGG
jgi:2-keto-4-pentenoate hydratase/2-oxohepta-3-ene-1,7-dioic acid hydratase in catechol pathway